MNGALTMAAPVQKAAPKPRQAATAKPRHTAGASLLLQHKCACGAGTSSATDKCDECHTKIVGLQTKLRVNEPGDAYEQEADRVADEVLARPAQPGVIAAPMRIQRFSGQLNEQADAAPASVDQVLTSPGRPLDSALQQDMEERFGHDFSRVRVHSGAAAEQSAQDVTAHAYTVGQNIVFGVGQFAPGTQEGRRLIAHELTHVVQQSGPDGHIGEFGRTSDTSRSGRELAHRTCPTVGRLQRAPAGPTPPVSSAYSGLAELEATMLQLFEKLAPETVATLTIHKTISIGWVSGEGIFDRVYTVSGNWINPDLQQAAEQMGLERWNPQPELVGERALIGAAADLEQLLINHAEAEGLTVEALAISRQVCEHCKLEIAHHNEGNVLVAEVKIPTKAIPPAPSEAQPTITKTPPAPPPGQPPQRGQTPPPQPSPKATAAPASAEPEPPTTTATTAAEGATFGARLARGARVVGGNVLLFAVQAFGTWLKGRFDELHIKYKIEQLQPTIMAEIKKRTDEIAQLQVNGSKAYGNVTIGILQIFAGGISQGQPDVSLYNIAITAREVKDRKASAPPPIGYTGFWYQKTEQTFSFEVKVFTDEELKELDSLSERYLADSRNLRMNPGSVELKEQRRITRNAIVEKFGRKVWLLELEATE